MKRLYIALLLSGMMQVCHAQSSYVQSSDPLFELHIFSDIYGKYSIDETHEVIADTNLIGIWKMDEDIDPHNYFVFERYNYYEFAYTYMNRGGTNRTYENGGMFFSKVGNANFINVGYSDPKNNINGCFYLKVTDMDEGGWHMTLSLVADTSLKYMNSSAEIKAQLAKNIDNPNYYKATIHFHKILPLMYCK